MMTSTFLPQGLHRVASAEADVALPRRAIGGEGFGRMVRSSAAAGPGHTDTMVTAGFSRQPWTTR